MFECSGTPVRLTSSPPTSDSTRSREVRESAKAPGDPGRFCCRHPARPGSRCHAVNHLRKRHGTDRRQRVTLVRHQRRARLNRAPARGRVGRLADRLSFLSLSARSREACAVPITSSTESPFVGALYCATTASYGGPSRPAHLHGATPVHRVHADLFALSHPLTGVRGEPLIVDRQAGLDVIAIPASKAFSGVMLHSGSRLPGPSGHLVCS